MDPEVVCPREVARPETREPALRIETRRGRKALPGHVEPTQEETPEHGVDGPWCCDDPAEHQQEDEQLRHLVDELPTAVGGGAPNCEREPQDREEDGQKRLERAQAGAVPGQTRPVQEDSRPEEPRRQEGVSLERDSRRPPLRRRVDQVHAHVADRADERPTQRAEAARGEGEEKKGGLDRHRAVSWTWSLCQTIQRFLSTSRSGPGRERRVNCPLESGSAGRAPMQMLQIV